MEGTNQIIESTQRMMSELIAQSLSLSERGFEMSAELIRAKSILVSVSKESETNTIDLDNGLGVKMISLPLSSSHIEAFENEVHQVSAKINRICTEAA